MGTVPTILGDLYVDDQGNHDEPVALLWPSLFTDHTMWRYQIPALRTAGLRTLTLDPPGHGQSWGVNRGFTMDECAKAALQVLDAANVHTPVVLLGTSWGGIVAPRVVLLAPGRVRGMALFNTTAESAAPFDWARATLLTKLLAISALDKMVDNMIVSLQLAPETRRRNPELGAELSRHYRSWNRRGLINTVRSVLVDRDTALHALHNVQVPALIVSGKEDTILPSPHSRRMVENLPKAHHIEVAGAAHLVPLEAPEAANKIILDFIVDLPRI
ncbi:MAG: alpha/beta hydrolase [Acidobacteriaceae bacterium]|nr:alpha/beta hydrolase [Acidobacteriaceae bacterium]MBV9296904.1 alpha/beta hydrolase [Acidobacteriaceae bacterium]MBV9764057.1 alpha/beta hydrolase [Acidobacteriaceae bacterium]